MYLWVSKGDVAGSRAGLVGLSASPNSKLAARTCFYILKENQHCSYHEYCYMHRSVYLLWHAIVIHCLVSDCNVGMYS